MVQNDYRVIKIEFRVRRCSCLRKYISASDIFLQCLNAEGQFGTECPETYADLLTITHSSKPGQIVAYRYR